MCVILVKPAGVKLPKQKIFKNCHDANSDGMGYCTISDGKVYGSKGFTDPVELHEHLARIPRSYPLIVHFRYATHGAVNKTATHPFPITSNEDELKATKWEADIGVAHNGIIPGFGSYTKKGLSDTQEYIRDVLSDSTVYASLFHPDVQRMIEVTSNSKFAFLAGTGELKMIGRFYESGGCFFSSLDYQSNRFTAKGHFRCYSYDWRKDPLLDLCSDIPDLDPAFDD